MYGDNDNLFPERWHDLGDPKFHKFPSPQNCLFSLMQHGIKLHNYTDLGTIFQINSSKKGRSTKNSSYLGEVKGSWGS